MCSLGYFATSCKISLTLHFWPSGAHDVYGVSHQTQRKLQPDVRIKTDGMPINLPSPCTE